MVFEKTIALWAEAAASDRALIFGPSAMALITGSAGLSVPVLPCSSALRRAPHGCGR